MSKPPKRAPKKKAGYAMPDPLPNGEILEDNTKKRWKLGAVVGKGGFGEIYSASEEGSKSSKYVIKIEPHENGPLFVEMHFYMRNAKPEDIQEFCKKKHLSHIGMPAYIGSGSHEHNGKKYRFLVMEKFGKDIWQLFLENNRKFPEATVYQLGLQILDVLEYIHSRGYIHADIKGSNILLSSTSKSRVYLVDFGLATHYNSSATFKSNPKKAHNGTIEYLSRDAHQGVETRRGDLEILAYNLIQWLGCTLPWESSTANPKVVQQMKEENLSNIKKFLKSCFKNPPVVIENLLKYISTLKFNDTPDYGKVRSILLAGLKEVGGTPSKALTFGGRKTPDKRRADDVSENGTPPPPKQARKPRKRLETVDEEETNSSTEENKKPAVKKTVRKKAPNKNEVKQNGNGDFDGYTAAMKEVAEKKRQKQKKGGTLDDPVPSTSTGITDARRKLRAHNVVHYYEDDKDSPIKKNVNKRKR